MNIFATYPDPLASAMVLDDARARKMILESCQILCTACSCNGYGGALPLKATHAHHPCVRWASASRENYEWLLRHAEALLERFHRTSGRMHVYGDGVIDFLRRNPSCLPSRGLMPHASCTGQFQHLHYTHEAYRRYLLHKWKTDSIRLRWFNELLPFGDWKTFTRALGGCLTRTPFPFSREFEFRCATPGTSRG